MLAKKKLSNSARTRLIVLLVELLVLPCLLSAALVAGAPKPVIDTTLLPTSVIEMALFEKATC